MTEGTISPARAAPATPRSPFRQVTEAEIRHFRENGWVHLKGFIPADHVRDALAVGKQAMGIDAATNDIPDSKVYFNVHPMRQLDHPVLAPVIASFGKCAAALSERPEVGVRYLVDYFAVKLPTSRADGHGKSDWHQDFAAQVADRSGAMTFWMALEDLPPDMGTMAFLSRSHREGVMGDFRSYGDANLLDAYPDVAQRCPSSGHLTMAAGDVTVHSDLCVHAAAANQSDRVRWTYITIINPGDIRWTGAPSIAYDTSGLEALSPLDGERYPRLD